MVSCRACHEQIPDGAKFCPHCGFRVAPLTVPANPAVPGGPRRGFPQTVRRHEAACADTLPGVLTGYEATRPSLPVVREGRTPRRCQRYPIVVQVHLSSAHNFYTAEARNISAGGLFVATAEPLPVGTAVEVQFTLPDLLHVYTARCTVRWLRRAGGLGDLAPGMGLSFEDLGPEVAEAIQAFLAHREPIAVSRQYSGPAATGERK